MKMCEDDDELINVNEIAYEDVELLEIVGEGSFGTVHRAQWQGHCVAVKEITKEKDAFKKELRHLARVSHHNIIKLFGACTKSKQIRGKLWLITDYLEGGSLYDLLHRRRASISYQLAHAMSWALQCIKGVEYLHSIQMMHRDLKPPNLLLNRYGTHLKICDFGTVADKKTYMTNNMGSAAYMAPEVFRSDKYTEKCDVYSWAIILWEVLARKRPFYKKDVTTFTILWQVNKGLRPPLIKDCPPSIERLMTRCWQHDADVRPKTDEIVRQMERFCAVLPSVSRVPLTIAGLNAAVTNIEDEAELVDAEEEDDNPQEINQFPEWQESGGVAKVLPQPSGDLCMPLEVVVDPNAWELKDDFLDDLPLQNNDHRMTGNHSNEQQQSASSTLADNAAADDDVYLLLESLEPDLRPATPDQSSAKSQQLYLEHIKMAREYYEMHEQMAFYNKQRTELKRRKERQQRLRQLEEERRNYQIMRNMLIQDYKDGNIQQRANQTSERRSPQADLLMESGSAEGAEGGAYLDDDNWVIVPDERKD